MTEGVTCYERDEDLCEDQMCLRTGCRLRNQRLSGDDAQKSVESREAAARLIDPDAYEVLDELRDEGDRTAESVQRYLRKIYDPRVEQALAKADAIFALAAQPPAAPVLVEDDGSYDPIYPPRSSAGSAADVARGIVTDWLGMFDPPPQIDFQQSELLQGAIATALACGDIDALTGTADDQRNFGSINEPQPVEVWQPIETAPKDRCLTGWKQGWEFGREVHWQGDGWVCAFAGSMNVQPTHWQPLPSPMTRPHHSGE